MKKISTFLFFCFNGFLAGFIVYCLFPVISTRASVITEEPQIYTLRLDQPTIIKGYTFISPTQDFKVGVIPEAVKEPVTVRFKRIPDSYMADQLKLISKEKASNIWEFDLLADDGEMGKLVKPIYLAIKINNTKMNRKIMHYWDNGRNAWRALPSSIDLENKLIRATIFLPYARIALFDEPNATVFEAWASWYPTELTKRNIWGCASNLYPMGSDIKICRLDDLSRCVNSTVISTGPFVDNRIVDLTKLVFEQIGNPRGGILGVRT